MTQDLHTPDAQSLIEFPCDYKLKAMGRNEPGFIELVYEITCQFAPNTSREHIQLNHSKDNNFVSVNITFYATCLEQLHAIYGELRKHPQVLMTL
ncbi:MAG: DUF493 domain-containing protein [Thiotrichales bacterium]|nr:DUF493 domain-containing protein [Thiotrichales bacterium]